MGGRTCGNYAFTLQLAALKQAWVRQRVTACLLTPSPGAAAGYAFHSGGGLPVGIRLCGLASPLPAGRLAAAAPWQKLMLANVSPARLGPGSASFLTLQVEAEGVASVHSVGLLPSSGLSGASFRESGTAALAALLERHAALTPPDFALHT
jgi:hypothetical protein